MEEHLPIFVDIKVLALAGVLMEVCGSFKMEKYGICMFVNIYLQYLHT